MGPFIVLTVLLLAAAWGASWGVKKLQVRGLALAKAVAIPLSQLAEDSAAVAKDMGAGSFRQEVRIRGKVVCESPLVAELSHTPCVSYKFSVTRELEEVILDRDSQGEEIRRTQRVTEVVASNQLSTSFWLDDGTAKIRVYPDGASIDWVKTLSSYRPVTSQTTNFTMGSFVLNLGTAPGGVLGYRYEEFCLPVNQEVTVVAEAGDEGGQLALRCPEEKGAPFLVSSRSFQELSKGNTISVSALKGVSIGLAAVAVLIFILGVVR